MFTHLQRRVLFVAGGLAIGYAIAFDGVHNRLLSSKSPPITSFISRGPYAGHRVGDCWLADDVKSHFSANQVVVWQLDATPKLSLALIVGTELWCGGHAVQFEETRLATEQVAKGWNSLGIEIPKDVAGECHLERHVQTQSENGLIVQDLQLPRTIALVVDP